MVGKEPDLGRIISEIPPFFVDLHKCCPSRRHGQCGRSPLFLDAFGVNLSPANLIGVRKTTIGVRSRSRDRAEDCDCQCARGHIRRVVRATRRRVLRPCIRAPVPTLSIRALRGAGMHGFPNDLVTNCRGPSQRAWPTQDIAAVKHIEQTAVPETTASACGPLSH
jgi:hypothetical protein